MTEPVKRRLTTVLCADVKSYTRLMEADETGTLQRLRGYRDAVAGLVQRHDGRIVNTWGDAIIAEFPSVIEATQCAIEVQADLADRNKSLPGDRQMWFRIGLNLGDVMVEGDNIYGEGVNIAARLQEMAEPGGIMVSGPVYDQVYRKLSVGFEPLGDQRLKNVTGPVLSYRVVLDDDRPKPSPVGQDDNTAASDLLANCRRSFVRFADWYAALPRPAAVGLAVIALLFLINLFSGMGSLWFHWPAAPILIWVLFVAMRGRRGPRQDR